VQLKFCNPQRHFLARNRVVWAIVH